MGRLCQYVFFALASLTLSTTVHAAPDVITHVVTVTVGPAIPSSKPQWKQDSSFTSAILSTTNSYRAQHNATALTWNSTLEDFASDYLDSNDCVFKHSGGPYGENLAIGYVNATASVRAWGDEREEYNFHAGKFSEKTGHFTQLVWKDTTDVGCGRRLCGSRGWYLVCEYWPRGNVVGAFKAEVQSQTGDGGGGLARPPKVGALAVVVTGLVLFAGWL